MAPPSVSVALLSASPGLSPSFSWPWVEVSLRILSPPLFPRLLPWQCLALPHSSEPTSESLTLTPPSFPSRWLHNLVELSISKTGVIFLPKMDSFFQLSLSSHRPAVFSGFLPVNLALSPSSHHCDLPTLTPKTSPGGDASVSFLLPLLFTSPPQFLFLFFYFF